MAEQRGRGLSLRRKVTGWLGAILAVTLVSIGMATAVGRWKLFFDVLSHR